VIVLKEDFVVIRLLNPASLPTSLENIHGVLRVCTFLFHKEAWGGQKEL
jgi:hypothetical protein